MEHIEPSFEITREDIEGRINWFSSEAKRINELSKIDRNSAIKEYRNLRDFSRKEYDIITQSRNSKFKMKNQNLMNYFSYFSHVHLDSGRVSADRLHWVLDEFNQGKLWYDVHS